MYIKSFQILKKENKRKFATNYGIKRGMTEKIEKWIYE